MEKAKYLVGRNPDIDFDSVERIAHRNIMNCQRFSGGCGDWAWHVFTVSEDTPNRALYAATEPLIEVEGGDDELWVTVYGAHLLRDEDYEALVRAGLKPAVPKRLRDVVSPCEGCDRADTVVYVADLGDGLVVFYEGEEAFVDEAATTREVCEALGLCR